MTGLFDFVSYAAGLGGTKWSRFAPALIVSVAISNPPIVALGAGVFSGGKAMLGFAFIGVFGLAIISGLTQRMQRKKTWLTKSTLKQCKINTVFAHKK